MAATTLSGWLPCSVLKKGYYNKDQFYRFITEFLIPCLKEAYGDAGKAVVMDNVQIHCDEAVRNALERAGYVVQYLPPYSPDFNPIVSFNVLRVCIFRLVLGCVNERYRHGSSCGLPFPHVELIRTCRPSTLKCIRISRSKQFSTGERSSGVIAWLVLQRHLPICKHLA
jgi:DDE superfamily endonuclease